MAEDERKPDEAFMDWLNRHPYTLGYIAAVTTLILIVNLVNLITNL